MIFKAVHAEVFVALNQTLDLCILIHISENVLKTVTASWSLSLAQYIAILFIQTFRWYLLIQMFFIENHWHEYYTKYTDPDSKQRLLIVLIWQQDLHCAASIHVIVFNRKSVTTHSTIKLPTLSCFRDSYNIESGLSPLLPQQQHHQQQQQK